MESLRKSPWLGLGVLLLIGALVSCAGESSQIVDPNGTNASQNDWINSLPDSQLDQPQARQLDDILADENNQPSNPPTVQTDQGGSGVTLPVDGGTVK